MTLLKRWAANIVAGARFWRDLLLGEDYHFTDDEHEMLTLDVTMKMDEFYLAFLRKSNLPKGGWQRVNIPFQSAKDLVGQFVKTSQSLCDTGWWLNGAHDVRVQGTLEVCRAGEKYHFRELATKWQWHDRIDANSYVTLVRNGENPVVIAVEGSYDILVDKIGDLDYYAVIHWDDDVALGAFPPGPLCR